MIEKKRILQNAQIRKYHIFKLTKKWTHTLSAFLSLHMVLLNDQIVNACAESCFKSKIFDSSNPFQDQIRRKHNLFGLFKVKRAEKSKKALFASSKKPNSHDLTILAYKQAKRWLKKTNEFCKMLKSESITSLSFQKVNSCGCRFFFVAYKTSNWR